MLQHSDPTRGSVTYQIFIVHVIKIYLLVLLFRCVNNAACVAWQPAQKAKSTRFLLNLSAKDLVILEPLPRCGGSVINLITDVDVVAISIKRINLAIDNTIRALPPEDCFYAICIGQQGIIVLISVVLRMVIW